MQQVGLVSRDGTPRTPLLAESEPDTPAQPTEPAREVFSRAIAEHEARKAKP
jgi:hypothetical protein